MKVRVERQAERERRERQEEHRRDERLTPESSPRARDGVEDELAFHREHKLAQRDGDRAADCVRRETMRRHQRWPSERGEV